MINDDITDDAMRALEREPTEEEVALAKPRQSRRPNPSPQPPRRKLKRSGRRSHSQAC